MKLLLVFLIVVGVALAFPRPPINRRISHHRAAARLRRAPLAAARRTMLIHGFHRHRFAQRRQAFEPETAMTAFATGDNVAAGSYLGSAGCPSCVEQDNNEFIGAPEPNEEPFSGPVQDYQPADAPLSDPSADTELAPPEPKPLRKPKAPKKEYDDEEDEDDYVPTKGKKGNTYFPVVFGAGAGRAGSGAGAPGGVTAIANSYSSGKGGVANSHATAYGSGASRRSRSKRPQDDSADDDE